MPAGVDFGTLVHRVFEATDFAAADLRAELATHVEAPAGAPQARDRRPAGARGGSTAAAIEYPAGGRCSGSGACADGHAALIAWTQLEFELPLAGGDEPTGRVTLRALASVRGG